MHRTSRSMSALCAFLLTILCAKPAAEAASIACATARKPHEIAICTHRDLLLLDTEMDALWFAYKRVPFLMGASGERQDEEQAFLRERAQCGRNAACLRRVYRNRIKALRDNFSVAMQNVQRFENLDPPDFPSSLPPRVEAIISDYAGQCRHLGGTLAGDTRPRMLAGDFDGDGKADYVLNPDNLRCSAAATAFCGNGGCQISITTSGNRYQEPITVMGGQPTLSQPAGATDVEVWVDRTNCSLSPDSGKACWAIYSWKDGKAQQTYRAKPRSD